MSISYSFVADWAFYRTAFARYRRQAPNRHRKLAVISLVALALACAWIYARATHAFWGAIPEFTLVGGIIGGIVGFIIGKLLLPIRLKRSPEFGTKVTVVLNDEGLIASGPDVQTTLNWPAFTRVARHSDGILFLRGRVLRWLPDTALQNATPEEATSFVRSKTSPRRNRLTNAWSGP